MQDEILEHRECVGWEMHAKPKPHIGDGWIDSRLFGLVDGKGASYDSRQSLSDTGEWGMILDRGSHTM